MRTIPARHVMQIYNSADRNIDSYAGSACRVKPVPRRGFPGGLTTESRAILASPLVVSGDGQQRRQSHLHVAGCYRCAKNTLVFMFLRGCLRIHWWCCSSPMCAYELISYLLTSLAHVELRADNVLETRVFHTLMNIAHMNRKREFFLYSFSFLIVTYTKGNLLFLGRGGCHAMWTPWFCSPSFI